MSGWRCNVSLAANTLAREELLRVVLNRLLAFNPEVNTPLGWGNHGGSSLCVGAVITQDHRCDSNELGATGRSWESGLNFCTGSWKAVASSESWPLNSIEQGSQTQIAQRAKWGSNPRAALRRWRNTGSTWTLQETPFTSYFLRKASRV